jgi:hypothetical protein
MGHFSPTAGSSACSGIAAAGHYSANAMAQTPCPAGTYTPAAGFSVCIPCPINTKCPTFGTVTPVPCPTFSASVGAATCDAQQAADDYYYYYNATAAAQCPAGSICPPTANHSQLCPNGNFLFVCASACFSIARASAFVALQHCAAHCAVFFSICGASALRTRYR